MSERRRRIGGALLVSLALHAAILVGLGFVGGADPPRIEVAERAERLSVQMVTVAPAPTPESEPYPEPEPQRKAKSEPEGRPEPTPKSPAVAHEETFVEAERPTSDDEEPVPPGESGPPPGSSSEEPPQGPREDSAPGLRAGLLPRTGLFAPGGPEISPRGSGSGVRVTNPWETGIRAGQQKSPQRALAELLGESKVRARNVHSYFVTLRDALLRHWEGEARRGPQAPNRPERCVVRLVQGPDGRLRELELLRRSGNRDMDTLVLRNLLLAELPEPPPEVVEGRELLETHWEFALLAHEIRGSGTFDLVTLFDPNAIPPPSDKRLRLLSVL